MGSSFGGRASAVPRRSCHKSRLGRCPRRRGRRGDGGVILNDVATSHAQGDFFVLKSRGSDGLQLWRRELDGGIGRRLRVGRRSGCNWKRLRGRFFDRQVHSSSVERHRRDKHAPADISHVAHFTKSVLPLANSSHLT